MNDLNEILDSLTLDDPAVKTDDVYDHYEHESTIDESYDFPYREHYRHD